MATAVVMRLGSRGLYACESVKLVTDLQAAPSLRSHYTDHARCTLTSCEVDKNHPRAFVLFHAGIMQSPTENVLDYHHVQYQSRERKSSGLHSSITIRYARWR